MSVTYYVVMFVIFAAAVFVAAWLGFGVTVEELTKDRKKVFPLLWKKYRLEMIILCGMWTLTGFMGLLVHLGLANNDMLAAASASVVTLALVIFNIRAGVNLYKNVAREL